MHSDRGVSHQLLHQTRVRTCRLLRNGSVRARLGVERLGAGESACEAYGDRGVRS